MHQFEGNRFGADGEVFCGKGVPEGYFLVFRWFINCCTADAEPLGIIVRSNEIQSGEESLWVHLEGTLKTRTTGRKRLAYIEAELVKRIPTPPPEERYITY